MSSYVYLPDAQAGPGHETWYQGRAVREEKKKFCFTRKAYRIYLFALAVFCGFFLLRSVSAQRAALAEKAQVLTAIENARNAQPSLIYQLQTTRDESRIGYLAANRLGMSAADDSTTLYLYVNEINEFAGTIERPAAAQAQQTAAEYTAVSRNR